MNTNVTIRTSMKVALGGRVPIQIHVNDTVTFRATGGPAKLVFPSHTAAIMKPKPEHEVHMADGAVLVFAFTSEVAGNYCLLALPERVPTPSIIDCSQAQVSGATLKATGRSQRPTPQEDPDTQPVMDPDRRIRPG